MRRNLRYIQCILMLVLLLLSESISSELHAQEHLSRNMLMLSNVNTEATDKLYSDASGGRNIKLLKDAHQRIFAYDNKGKLYIYNKVEDRFLLTHDLLNILGGSLVVNEIVTDAKGNFWIAMDRGLYLLPALPAGGMDEEVLPVHPRGKFVIKNTYISHLSFVGQRLLVGTPQGAYVYQPKTKRKQQIVNGCYVLSSYYDAARHQLWLGTFHEGIRMVDDRSWCTLPLPSSLQEIPQIPIRSIISYDAQTLLMAVDGAGVYAYDKQSGQTKLLLNTDGRPGNALQGNGVYALCRDRLGDIWIGSYSGGVDFAIPMEHSLEYVRHEYLSSQFSRQLRLQEERGGRYDGRCLRLQCQNYPAVGLWSGIELHHL